jgi:transposase
MEIRVIGIDLGKKVFHLVGVNQSGEVVLRRKLSRAQLLRFTSNLRVHLIGVEACGETHFLGRALCAQGHEIRLMPMQYVKTNRNDSSIRKRLPRQSNGRGCALYRSRASETRSAPGRRRSESHSALVLILAERVFHISSYHEGVTDKHMTLFLHRMNTDGRHDSICPDCLRTISTRPREADLTVAEEHHICNEVIHRLIGERLGRKAPSVN